MRLKRVADMSAREATKIYARIKAGTMKYYLDDIGYTLFDEDELANYKPKKSGRPPKGKRDERT